MHVMTRLAGVLAIAVIAGTAPAAQKPAASNDHRYDVTFAFDGDRTYTGAMTLTFDGSRVSGKMAIDTPAVVTGTVAGTVKAGALSLDYPYQVAGDSPCTGRVTVSAKLSADRSSAAGTTHAEGCGDPHDGTFTLAKPSAAKPAKPVKH